MMRYQEMMEFSFGPWGTEGQDGIANLGLGFKSINIGETQVAGIEFSIAGTGRLVNNTRYQYPCGLFIHRSNCIRPFTCVC